MRQALVTDYSSATLQAEVVREKPYNHSYAADTERAMKWAWKKQLKTTQSPGRWAPL